MGERRWPYVTRYRGRDGRTVANDDNARWIRPAFNQMRRVLKPGGFVRQLLRLEQGGPVHGRLARGRVRRPLFAEAGHHVGRFFADLEQLHRPAVVVEDYEAVHTFLHELTTYLNRRTADFFDNVIEDSFPGFETKQCRRKWWMRQGLNL